MLALVKHPLRRLGLGPRLALILGAGCALALAVLAVQNRLAGAPAPAAADPAGLAAVEGRVLLDGRPLDGAAVYLLPAQGGDGRGAYAWTQADGRFRLKTPCLGDGVLPGAHKVLVRVRGFLLPQELARARHALRIPPCYGDLGATPLACTVPLAGNLVLDLKSPTAP